MRHEIVIQERPSDNTPVAVHKGMDKLKSGVKISGGFQKHPYLHTH